MLSFFSMSQTVTFSGDDRKRFPPPGLHPHTPNLDIHIVLSACLRVIGLGGLCPDFGILLVQNTDAIFCF